MGGITYQAKDTEENKTKSEKYWRLKKNGAFNKTFYTWKNIYP